MRSGGPHRTFILLFFLFWLHWVFVAVCGLSCSRALWDLSSSTRGGTQVYCTGRWILNHWTTSEVLGAIYIKAETFPTCPLGCIVRRLQSSRLSPASQPSRGFIQTQLLSKTPNVCASPPFKGSLTHDLWQPLITNDASKGHSPSIGKARTTEQRVLY